VSYAQAKGKEMSDNKILN